MSDEERRMPPAEEPRPAPSAPEGDAAPAAAGDEAVGGVGVLEGAMAAAEPAATAGRGDPLAAGVAVLVVAALLLCAGLVSIAAG